jgi:hypothetical protein
MSRSFAAVSASSSTPSVSLINTVHWRASEKEPLGFEALRPGEADGGSSA